MKDKQAAQEGVWQYKANWGSALGGVALAMVTFAGIAGLGALLAPALWTWLLAAAVFFGGLALLAGRPILFGDWVLRVGPRGISSYLLNGRTVPWRDVRDLRVETVQGNTFLVLQIAAEAKDSLQKTRRWWSGRGTERRLNLSALRKPDATAAVEAAMRTFAERAAEHAAAAVEARAQEARAEAAFEQQLAHHTNTTWALYLLVALNVGAWVLNVAGGMSAMRPATDDLFRWGAISAWAVRRDGEWWRLLAGTFLHGGLVHLAMNMLGLWGAGKLLNRMVGNAQFLLVYLLSALAGASASLHFAAQAAVSVGASGAVFGVVGALVVAVRRRREHLPKALARQIMTSEAVFLVYALANGFAREGIDNAAHVGGLLAGGAMGLVLLGVTDAAGAGMRRLRATAVAVAGAAVVVAVVLATPAPPVDHARMFAAARLMRDIMPRYKEAVDAVQKDVQEGKAGRLGDDEFVRKVEALHLPALRRLHDELKKVPRAQGDPRAFLATGTEAIAANAIEGLEVLVREQRGEARPEDKGRTDALQQEMETINRRMREQAEALMKPKAR